MAIKIADGYASFTKKIAGIKSSKKTPAAAQLLRTCTNSRLPDCRTISIDHAVIIAAIISNSEGISDKNEKINQQSEIEDLKEDRDKIVSSFAPQYCKTHQSTVTTFKDSNYPSNNGSGWTEKECKKIIGLLYDGGSDSKALKKNYRDIYSKVCKPSSYRRFEIKEAK